MKNKISPLDLSPLYDFLPKADSGIHINPANKGKFNATKKRTGKTTEELTHSKNPLTRKRAIFAQNAAKWHHADDGDTITPTPVDNEGEKKKKANSTLEVYKGGIEKTPTGQINAFSNNDFGLSSEKLNEYANKYNLPTTSNKDFQEAQLKMLNSTPYGRQLIDQMNEKFGPTKAGTYADGLLGARTRYLIDNYNPPSSTVSSPEPSVPATPSIKSYPQPTNYYVNVRGEGDANGNHNGAYYFVKDADTLKKIQDSGLNIHSAEYAHTTGSVNYDMPDSTFREQLQKNKDVYNLLGDAYIRNPKNPKEFIKKSDYISQNSGLKQYDGGGDVTPIFNYANGKPFVPKNLYDLSTATQNGTQVTHIPNVSSLMTGEANSFNDFHDLPDLQVKNNTFKQNDADLVFRNKNFTIGDATQNGVPVTKLDREPALKESDVIHTTKNNGPHNGLLFAEEALMGLNSLVPQERINDRYLRPEESMTNPSYGTGSQAIAESGATIPGLTGNLYGKAVRGAKKRKAENGDLVKEGKEMLKQKMEYVSSPLYKKRLMEQGVKNPDEVIANRLQALKNTKINPPRINSQTLTYSSSDGYNKNQKSDVFLSDSANKYDLAHEIGHVTTGGSEYIPTYGANNTVGTQMSPIEDWKFYNRNKALEAPDPNFPGKTMRETAYDMYTHGENKLNDPYNSDSIHRITANNLYEVTKGQSDPHNITARENKSDLDAIRQLLYDNKITKNYGDDISQKDLEKAKKNKNIMNEKHFKRFMSNFDDNSLIYLNNNIASNQNSTNDIQLADDGAQVVPTSAVTNEIIPLWGGSPQQMSNNPYDGGTIKFSGDSHEDGGVGIVYHGNPVEVEGEETGIIDREGSLNIMGNMYVPGTKTKFKTVSKKIAEAENQANSQLDKSLNLIENTDPNYHLDLLKANSSMMMKKGADIKHKNLSEQKQSLVNLQNAMLDTANEFGIDAQEMSRGNIKPIQMKKNIKKADSGIGNIKSSKKQLFPLTDYNTKLNNYNNYLLLNDLNNPDNNPVNSNNNTPEVVLPTSAPVQSMPGQNDVKKIGNVTNAEKLNPLQLLGEAYAIGTNRLITTPYQRYTPTLMSPVNYSFRDQLNENEASLKGIEKQLGYNPTALAILKGQEYQANNSVLGNEFRTNQQEYNAVRNKNTEILNDAKLRNLQMDDTNAVRKVQALTNTRRQNIDILNSIASKFLQNNLESRKLKAYENLYPNYRFNEETGQLELVNANQDFSNLGVMSNYGVNTTGKKYVVTDGQGNVKNVKTVYNDPTTQNINQNREVITGTKARQAMLSGIRPLYKDGGNIVKKTKYLK